MLWLMAQTAGGISGTVNVDGATVFTQDFGAGANECKSGVRFNADGTVDMFENEGSDVYTQIDASTDWIIPNLASTGATYWIKAEEDSYSENQTNPSIFGTKVGTMSTYLELGSAHPAREWSLTTNSNTAGAGDVEWAIIITIARDSGGTDIIDTGTYTFQGAVS